MTTFEQTPLDLGEGFQPETAGVEPVDAAAIAASARGQQERAPSAAALDQGWAPVDAVELAEMGERMRAGDELIGVASTLAVEAHQLDHFPEPGSTAKAREQNRARWAEGHQRENQSRSGGGAFLSPDLSPAEKASVRETYAKGAASAREMLNRADERQSAEATSSETTQTDKVFSEGITKARTTLAEASRKTTQR